MHQLSAIRGSILHCLCDPGVSKGDAHDSDAVEFFEDGLLLVINGRIDRLGPANVLWAE